jgi:hypothetical protein
MTGLRRRTVAVLLVGATALGGSAAAVYATGNGSGPPPQGHGHGHGHHRGQGFPPNVNRFNLAGYKIKTTYTLGRNTGNAFEQTYTGTTVQGVPVEGPFVGTTFPPQNYVALPIARKTLYIVWLDPATNDIVDAFVMNFKTGVVFDYAPGSPQPESSGTVRILQKGSTPLP